MKLIKILAAAALAVSIQACSCEDLELGKLEFTNELISFLPAQPTQGKSYFVAVDGANQRMNYVTDGVTSVTIPVRKKNYSGKFDPNSCKEYFTADQKEFKSQIEGENPLSFKIIYRKDANPDRFNSTIDKNNVPDVIEFVVGYNNKFPEPIQTGSTSSSNYITLRSFIFGDATTATIDNYTYTQEFLPTVTIDGVQHENVYHLYLNQPSHYRPEEQYIHDKYPGLDYIDGIYVKEGFGVIYAYSFKDKQIAITID